MAEEKPRRLKVLEELSKFTEPVGATEIAGIIGEIPRDVGKDLYQLGKGGLASKPDEKQSLWLITDKGKKYIEHPLVLLAGPLGRPSGGPSGGPLAGQTTDVGVPNQADVLRYYGEKLHVGIARGGKQEGTPLDAIIFFVQETADLNDLLSVWNALSKMAVPGDVKKRWIELYAKSIPGKEIPEELKEKIEAGQEGEKVREAGKGEITPKPKRFSIVGGEIIGDPEGDYFFNEALKVLAQQKGVPPEQASPLAAMVEAMKLGPEMATQTLTAMIPLLTKEPPKSNDNVLLQFMQTQTQNTQQQMQALQQMILSLTEDKHKAEMESLKALITTGQRAPEADQRLDALTKQIETLRESLHQEQLTRMTEQNQRTAELLQGEIKRLEQQIQQAAQSQHAESSLGLLSKAVDKLDGQLSGIRGDAKPLAEMIMKAGGPGPAPRSLEDRARLASIGKEAVLKEKRARELEDELLSL